MFKESLWQSEGPYGSSQSFDYFQTNLDCGSFSSLVFIYLTDVRPLALSS